MSFVNKKRFLSPSLTIQLKEADRLDTIGKVVGKCDKDTIKNY